MIMMLRAALAALCFAPCAANALTPAPEWADSYSVGGQCYCATSFDHDIGELPVATAQGTKTVREVCTLLGPGPGVAGNPIYNDVQCGHGPPNDLGDEQVCPGRVDLGEAGCDRIGPTWNLDALYPAPTPPAPAPIPQQPTGIDPAEADAELGAIAGPLPGSLALEAEAADTPDDRWVAVAPDAPGPYGPGGPDDPNDPDAPHLERASGAAYLELLPDARRSDADPLPEGGSWEVPGAGPRLQYTVDFPVAGEWTVRARLHPTGAHDTMVFAGLDGAFDAGGLLAACAEPGRWAWSDCGDGAALPVVQVPVAGLHTFELAGRDDGIEIDRLLLSPPVADAADPGGPAAGPGTDQAVDPTAGEGGPDAPVDPVAPDATAVPQGPPAPDLGRAVTVGGGVAPGVATTGGALLLLLAPLVYARRRVAARRADRDARC